MFSDCSHTLHAAASGSILVDLEGSPKVDRSGTPCSAGSALASMGRAEVESIIKEQGVVEMTCEFCTDTIVFTEQELLSAKDEI